MYNHKRLKQCNPRQRIHAALKAERQGKQARSEQWLIPAEPLTSQINGADWALNSLEENNLQHEASDWPQQQRERWQLNEPFTRQRRTHTHQVFCTLKVASMANWELAKHFNLWPLTSECFLFVASSKRLTWNFFCVRRPTLTIYSNNLETVRK